MRAEKNGRDKDASQKWLSSNTPRAVDSVRFQQMRTSRHANGGEREREKEAEGKTHS